MSSQPRNATTPKPSLNSNSNSNPTPTQNTKSKTTHQKLPLPPSIPIPTAFRLKKSQILSSLQQPRETYTDKSPKGTVDAQIQDLIQEINSYEGLVTTSSCAGRVAVFVEGVRDTGRKDGDGDGDDGDVVGEEDGQDDGDGENRGGQASDAVKVNSRSKATTTTTSPGGKGGGRWLYVSHDTIPIPPSNQPSTSTGTDSSTTTSHPAANQHQENYFSQLFNLPSTSSHPPRSSNSSPSPPPRLIHLLFSPLILHISCATLHHARPLLSAAINAGFRESGVQSLKILDPVEREKGGGVMVAVRTAGLGFSSVVGCVRHRMGVREKESGMVEQGKGEEELTERIVTEEYLRMCVGVINERFKWNDERRERFRTELKRAMEREGFTSTFDDREDGEGREMWEDKDERRRRQREEGLARQQVAQYDHNPESITSQEEQSDDLVEDLSILDLE